MADVDQGLLHEAILAWEGARHGEKEAVLQSWLPLLGLGRDRFYRELKEWGRETGRKVRADKGRSKSPEREKWVRAIMRLKYTRLKGVRTLATADAVKLALQWGQIPLEAAEMSLGTINKMARRLNLLPTPRRENRFEAEYPNQLHQVDASGSVHFYRPEMKGGEWVVRVRPRPLKNKEKVERLRVWVWGMTDDFSGTRVCRYIVAPGESARDGIEFLQWAWEKNPAHAPFEGLPDILYMDNGVLAKHHAVQHFCKEIGVNLTTHEAYRPQATGKVETGWQDQWLRFESLFLRYPDWRTMEISLTELNQEFYWFRRESNQRNHRRLPLTKETAWLKIMERGGPVSIEPGSWSRIFRRFERTLDAAGCFDLEGTPYQVKEIWSCRVRVYQGFRDDTILVEDLRDGKRYPAAVFQPKLVGEYRGAPKTELEQLLEEPLEVVTTRPTWRPEQESNVLHLVRAGEVRESSFVMPPLAKPAPAASLEEVARGVEVIRRSAGGDACATGARDQGSEEPEIYATEVDWYAAMRVKELRGERLAPETLARMAQIREESRAYRLLSESIERRAQMGAAE